MHESMEPVTGASIARPPAAPNSCASARIRVGVLVVRSIQYLPSQSPARMPFGPRTTCSICTGPKTIDITMSTWPMSYRWGVAPQGSVGHQCVARLAPDVVHEQVESCPAHVRAAAPPMFPKPMNPTFTRTPTARTGRH